MDVFAALLIKSWKNYDEYDKDNPKNIDNDDEVFEEAKNDDDEE